MKNWILLLSVYGAVVGLSSPPAVKVEHGELVGTTYRLPNGEMVYSFLGIPYAAPPTQKHRFKEPQNLKPWPGIWNATVLVPSCLQYTHRTFSIIGEEDCLYLNVYTPKLPENGISPLMDVLVYIHGGAFMFGSGQTIYPDYIMQNSSIVFVTINYRVGILGFFSTGDTIVPGNNGLKDQVAALTWVHRNIIKFGGNPASVTIAGCSAGGVSVHYHMLSTLSDGLFQKAISLSGTALPPWTLPQKNTEKSIRLSALVGCPINSTRDMVKCLRKRPAHQLVHAMTNFLTWRYCPFTAFGPVVEPVSSNNYLTEEPAALLRSGRIKNIPWLTSLCKDEGLYPAADFISDDKLLQELNDRWNEISPNLLMFNFSVESDRDKNHISNAIRQFYFGDRPISKVTVKEIIQMLGDRNFYIDIIRAIKLHSAGSKANIFCYRFNYRGKYSLSNVYMNKFDDYGTSHSDDLLYVVKYLATSSEETESDSAMVKLMRSIFLSFIKTGNPNVNLTQWEPVSTNSNNNLRCLDINSPVSQEMSELDYTASTKFWEDLFPSEYQPDSVIRINNEL